MLGVGTSPAPLTEAQLQGKRQQLDTTRKRMAAVAKQLDRLQKEEDASAPPMFAHRHPRRPVGLSDSLRSKLLELFQRMDVDGSHGVTRTEAPTLRISIYYFQRSRPCRLP